MKLVRQLINFTLNTSRIGTFFCFDGNDVNALKKAGVNPEATRSEYFFNDCFVVQITSVYIISVYIGTKLCAERLI